MTYEYTCSNCKYDWEEDQPISAESIKICPSCKQETAKRLVSGGTAFILEGGGWARDGYKK